MRERERDGWFLSLTDGDMENVCLCVRGRLRVHGKERVGLHERKGVCICVPACA